MPWFLAKTICFSGRKIIIAYRVIAHAKHSTKESASMLTRDGVRLDADIYRPCYEGEFLVLLMRQPYGRAIASTLVYAPPTWYATF